MADEQDETGPLSYRKAALRSVFNPGSGQIYAGATLRGNVTMVAFFVAVLGAGWVGFDLVFAFRTMLQRILDSGGLESGPSILAASLGRITSAEVLLALLPFLLIELLWYWALADTLQRTREENRRRGFDKAPNPVMTTLCTLCSPGAGHAYAGAYGRGWTLVAAYALVKVVYVPETIQGIVKVLQATRGMTDMSLTGVMGVYSAASSVSVSFVAVLIGLVWYGAMADALIASRRGPGDLRGNRLLAAALGFFCPGSGQIYAGWDTAGWAVLGIYVALSGLGGWSGSMLLSTLAFLLMLGSLVHAVILAHQADRA